MKSFKGPNVIIKWFDEAVSSAKDRSKHHQITGFRKQIFEAVNDLFAFANEAEGQMAALRMDLGANRKQAVRVASKERKQEAELREEIKKLNADLGYWRDRAVRLEMEANELKGEARKALLVAGWGDMR